VSQSSKSDSVGQDFSVEGVGSRGSQRREFFFVVGNYCPSKKTLSSN
jgi:hypothetical protein